jgi:hypothetical protein
VTQAEDTTESVTETSEDTTEQVTEAAQTEVSEGETLDTTGLTLPWQGLLVYKIDLQNNSFVQTNQISCPESEDSDSLTSAVLYRDNMLYILSDDKVNEYAVEN